MGGLLGPEGERAAQQAPEPRGLSGLGAERQSLTCSAVEKSCGHSCMGNSKPRRWRGLFLQECSYADHGAPLPGYKCTHRVPRLWIARPACRRAPEFVLIRNVDRNDKR